MVRGLNATHDAQRELLFDMLHGIYCDPNSPESARLNALDLCLAYKSKFTAPIKSNLINKHSDYLAKRDKQRYKASLQFFEKLSLISLLNESEKHNIIYKASKDLWKVHLNYNNFYNEPPFAERLYNLSKQSGIPLTIKEFYVNVVVACYLGNGYGVSWEAEPFYEKMIRDFSPSEIKVMLDSVGKSDSFIAMKLRAYPSCVKRFIQALSLIEPSSVPDSVKQDFLKWLKKA